VRNMKLQVLNIETQKDLATFSILTRLKIRDEGGNIKYIIGDNKGFKSQTEVIDEILAKAYETWNDN